MVVEIYMYLIFRPYHKYGCAIAKLIKVKIDVLTVDSCNVVFIKK